MKEENQTISSPQVAKSESLVKKFSDLRGKPSFKEVLIPSGIILAIILAGGATGYFLASRRALGAGLTTTKELIGGAELVEGPREVGIKDAEAFRDTAKGKIEINDDLEMYEGSHKLIRPGGPSQTVHITSSVVDLNQFIGKCVQVWGGTFTAQKAGWLMDIGRVKILDSCPGGL